MRNSSYTYAGKLLLPLLLTWLSYSGYAQQEAQFSQYMNDNLLVNPAVTGIENFMVANIGYRNQWTGLNGAMKTTYITVHQRLGEKGNSHSLPVRGVKAMQQTELSDAFRHAPSPHGVGGYFFKDDQGRGEQTGVGGSYAYHMSVGKQGNLSFGISAGIIQYKLLLSAFNPLEGGDALLAEDKATSITPDVSGGVWYATPTYYFGIGADQLSRSKINLSKSTSANKQANHFFVSGGYKVEVNDEIDLMPSVLVKYVNPAPPSYDLNLIGSYQDKFSFGFSYRNEDAVILIAGFNYDTMHFGYSYDINTSALSAHNNGTHELNFGIGLGANAKKGKQLHW